jgi:pimeloyl-ACP methyl ester carboxylesterase
MQKRLLRVTAVVIGLVALLAFAGVLYQLIATRRDVRRYPPPEKLVDVGGHRLHLYCTGEGSPIVILEAMGNGWSLYWSQVQPAVARFTRVCSYDRAGYGWSEPGPLPRTGQVLATELHTLLTNAGITGPYVLVGHSLGGFIIRLYHSQYPSNVVGMVLVDAGHEDQLQHQEFRIFFETGQRQLPAVRVAAALGIPRLLSACGVLPPFLTLQLQQVHPEVRPMLLAGWLPTQYFTTIAAETAVLEETLTQVRASGTLSDLPLVVLTANGPTWWPDLPAGIDPAKFKTMWLTLQQSLTTLSSTSAQLFADKSSHFMQFDQPDVIVDGVRRVVEMARQKKEG